MAPLVSTVTLMPILQNCAIATPIPNPLLPSLALDSSLLLGGGASLNWKSQLQSATALSTMEAEYSALSQSLCTLLPLQSLLLEVATTIGICPHLCATIHAHAFEDNQGAFLLATNQQLMNRTKYYIVKWHHFWGHVKDGTLTICCFATEFQQADGHTKGLVHEVFKCIHKLNQGW